MSGPNQPPRTSPHGDNAPHTAPGPYGYAPPEMYAAPYEPIPGADGPWPPEYATAPPVRPLALLRSNTGLVAGLLGGGAVLLVLIVVVAVAFGGEPSKKYAVGTPSSAGGLVLDRSSGAITGTVTSRERAIVKDTGAKIRTTVSGFYRDPSSSSFLPVGVVFVGGTGDMGDPDTFLRGTGPSTATVTDPGGDGKGACVTAGSTTTCMWATEHSFGMVTPTTPKSPADLSVLMRRMRPDLERPK